MVTDQKQKTPAEILSDALGGKKVGNQWKAKCPSHDDIAASLSINNGNNGQPIIHDFGNCSDETVIAKLREMGLWHEKDNKKKPRAKITERIEYLYCSNGITQYKKIRTNYSDGKKTFIFEPKNKGISLLYHGDEIQEGVEQEKPVFFVEGEKDVETMLLQGFVASTTDTPKGAFPEFAIKYFPENHPVYIIPDADVAGQLYKDKIATTLKHCKVYVIDLGYSIGTKKDISDWFADGHTVTELQVLIENAPLYTFKPRIFASDQNLPNITKEAFNAMTNANVPVKYFNYMDSMYRMDFEDNLQELTIDRMRHELARNAEWYKMDKKGKEEIEAKPPRDIISDMFASAEYPFPQLVRITYCPTFSRNGELLTKRGFYPDSGLYVSPGNIILPEILPEIKKAVAFINNDLFVDFPFDTNADKTNAWALLLLPFARELIDGLVPAWLLNAPKAGTGKGLECQTSLDIGTNSTETKCNYAVFPPVETEEETRKRITSAFMSGKSAFIFDNEDKPINSGVLATLLTTGIWTDRLLGGNETISVANKAIWIITANNPIISKELARRSISIRIVADVEEPYKKKNFKHDIKIWAREHRTELIAACLSIVDDWIQKGKKLDSTVVMGSFESFSKVMGGILKNAGLKDFLGNWDSLLENTDTQGDIVRRFLDEWWKEFGIELKTASDIYPVANSCEGLIESKGFEIGDRKKVLGNLLSSLRDQIIGDYKIILSDKKSHSALQYRLKSLSNKLWTKPEKEIEEKKKNPLDTI